MLSKNDIPLDASTLDAAEAWIDAYEAECQRDARPFHRGYRQALELARADLAGTSHRAPALLNWWWSVLVGLANEWWEHSTRVLRRTNR